MCDNVGTEGTTAETEIASLPVDSRTKNQSAPSPDEIQ